MTKCISGRSHRFCWSWSLYRLASCHISFSLVGSLYTRIRSFFPFCGNRSQQWLSHKAKHWRCYLSALHCKQLSRKLNPLFSDWIKQGNLHGNIIICNLLTIQYLHVKFQLRPRRLDSVHLNIPEKLGLFIASYPNIKTIFGCFTWHILSDGKVPRKCNKTFIHSCVWL